jgi:hypothetical protein
MWFARAFDAAPQGIFLVCRNVRPVVDPARCAPATSLGTFSVRPDSGSTDQPTGAVPIHADRIIHWFSLVAIHAVAKVLEDMGVEATW